jgi:hypothetical protein
MSRRSEHPPTNPGVEPPGTDRRHEPGPPLLRWLGLHARAVGNTGGREAVAAMCAAQMSATGRMSTHALLRGPDFESGAPAICLVLGTRCGDIKSPSFQGTYDTALS